MPSVHAKVIVNPAAGTRTAYRCWPEIRSLLRGGGLPFDFQYTEGAGHAALIARTAVSNGYRLLVAVGGDGTINEVANGILTASCAEVVTLGIVGTGTGNDLVRSLGLPREYAQACRRLIAGYQHHAIDSNGEYLCIDVGLVAYMAGGVPCERYFVNGAGVGFDAEVVEAAGKMPRRFGHTVPFVMGLLRTLPSYRNKWIRLTVDDQTEEARILSVVVSNGAYFGGGMRIAPDAMLTDQKLNMVAIGDVGKVELLRVFPRVYKGTHITHPKVRAVRVEEVAVVSQERTLLQADGELLGEGPVSFRVVPQALHLVL
ncbi:MAG: diacylglycerol kinase family lipid kinase [Dehalococcoidia bacterium]|nr:diacylglycerol kinase family lipid kinase [Dehalococcoidia bacterium]